MENIQHNLQIIHQRIEKSCIQSGRKKAEVKLLLASKTVSTERIKFALQAGEKLLGENKVQEGIEKFEAFQNFDFEYHFIGHLQTNKIKDVLKWCTCIQSVDSIPLVEKLDAALQKIGKKLPIFMQVNTSDEKSKSGVSVHDFLALAKKIKSYETLSLQGLMAIGEHTQNEKRTRICFQKLKQIQFQLKEIDINAPALSMGMSGDMEIAIEEGSTLLRVGSAVFGERLIK